LITLNSRSKRLLYGLSAYALIALLFVIASPASQSSASQNQNTLSRYASLKVLMKDAIHEHFTLISFTIWHDESAPVEKMPRISEAARELQKLAQEIPQHARNYHAGNSEKTNTKDIQQLSKAMGEAAHDLSEAAARGEEASMEKLFNNLQASCESCHSVYRANITSNFVNSHE
jgi:cytochrome c556